MKKKKWKIIGICIAVSFIFLALFSPYTSILNQYFGIDSAQHWVIGRGILRGKVPYKDLFDHKGPMLFLIWALGVAIGAGTKWGIFLLQVISLTISLFYLYKICKLFTKTSHTSNGNCSLKIQQYRQSDNKLSPCSRSG